MKYLLRYFFLVMATFLSCTDKEAPSLDSAAYFPLRVGSYRIYDIQETLYSISSAPVVLSYQLKAEVVDSFPNAEDGFTYVFHRSVRNSESEPWQFAETWSARKNFQGVVVNEGNTSFVKISFPVYFGKEWDGNKYNSLGEEYYRIDDLLQSFQVEDQSFSDVVMIKQSDKDFAERKDERTEVYARDIGLVYKESKVWEYYCPGGQFCTGEIASGLQWIQVLIDHGQN